MAATIELTLLHPFREDSKVAVNSEAYQRLISQIGARVKGGAGGKQPVELPPLIVAMFTQNFQLVVKELGGIDATVAAAQGAYDAYVTPVDLPQVPNFIEPTVDSAAKYLIGVILRVAWEQVNKNKIEGAPASAAEAAAPVSGQIGSAGN